MKNRGKHNKKEKDTEKQRKTQQGTENDTTSIASPPLSSVPSPLSSPPSSSTSPPSLDSSAFLSPAEIFQDLLKLHGNMENKEIKEYTSTSADHSPAPLLSSWLSQYTHIQHVLPLLQQQSLTIQHIQQHIQHNKQQQQQQ